MERSISISELLAENGVAVVNAYGSIIGGKEDHVDDSTMEVCWYLYITTVEISSLRFGMEICLLISILIDPIHFGIERTGTVKVSVFLSGGLIGVTFAPLNKFTLNPLPV